MSDYNKKMAARAILTGRKESWDMSPETKRMLENVLSEDREIQGRWNHYRKLIEKYMPTIESVIKELRGGGKPYRDIMFAVGLQYEPEKSIREDLEEMTKIWNDLDEPFRTLQALRDDPERSVLSDDEEANGLISQFSEDIEGFSQQLAESEEAFKYTYRKIQDAIDRVALAKVGQ